MHNRPFYFSLIVGLTVTLLGFTLSLLGPAGLSLAMVGIGVTGLSIFSWWKTRDSNHSLEITTHKQPLYKG